MSDDDVGMMGGWPVTGQLSRFGRGQPSKLLCTLSYAQLRKVIPPPQSIEEKSSKKQLDPDVELDRQIRAKTQRPSESAKKRNRGDFATYISDGMKGESFTLPPMTGCLVYGEAAGQLQLATPSNKAFGAFGTAELTVPFDGKIALFDGDTQRGAYYELERMAIADPVFRQKVMGMPVDLELYMWEQPGVSHEERIAWCRQSFYDRNVLGVKVNPSLAITMDARDPNTLAMDSLIKTMPEIAVDRQHRQLRKGQTDLLTTASVLRQFVAGFSAGFTGLQKGTEPEAGFEQNDLEEWTKTLVDTLGMDKLKDRQRYVLGGSCVLVALGILGHYRYYPGEGDPQITDKITRRLAEIDWTAGEHWNNVAGKWVKKTRTNKLGLEVTTERLVIYGPKEGAGHVLDAILEKPDSGGDRITYRPVKVAV
jgi:hypothetical protein